MAEQHVAVIGGGLSGMTSALLLARHGHAVTLVEKSPCLGLTVRGFMRQGVYFDTGLHYTGGLNEHGVVTRYLRYLGIQDINVMAFSDDGFDEIRFADTGQTVRLPVGYEAMRVALEAQFPEERDAVNAYMEAARADFDGSSLLNFFFDTQSGKQNRSTISLDAFLKSLTASAHLRTVLSMHALLYGVSPEEVSFTQHAYVSASYFDAVHNFSGGGRALVEAMEQKLDELGVTVLRGRAVRRLICGPDKRLTSLELDDDSLLGVDAAISTVHPSVLAAMGQDVFRPAYSQRLRELEETNSAYMLFGIADTKPECLRGRNLFLCRDARLAEVFLPGAKPEAGPFYVASSPQPEGDNGQAGIVVIAPGNFDDVRAWADGESGGTRANRPESYRLFKREIMQRIQRSLVELCPELGAVRFVDAATPLTMRDYLHTPHGGLYGCKHTINQFNPMPMTRIPNVWLAGQSVIAPGLMGVMISAFLACGLFLGHMDLYKDATCN